MTSRSEMPYGDEGIALLLDWEERHRNARKHQAFLFFSYSIWAPNTWNTTPVFRVVFPSVVKSLEVPSKPCLEVGLVSNSKFSQVDAVQ